jgi:hypothetical protein
LIQDSGSLELPLTALEDKLCIDEEWMRNGILCSTPAFQVDHGGEHSKQGDVSFPRGNPAEFSAQNIYGLVFNEDMELVPSEVTSQYVCCKSSRESPGRLPCTKVPFDALQYSSGLTFWRSEAV